MCALAGAALLAGACSSGAKPAADEGARDEFAGETRDPAIKHEACDPKGHTVRSYKADDPLTPSVKLYVTHVYDGSNEICSCADLNGDGRIDVYTYYGAVGKSRRREASYTVESARDEITRH